ncbi:hypothetical protein BJY01DRAFT_251722 [Aspergillus pseudoustus]|uniref:F-box domain-containing protein n=1 Tax=Aspergillus pseudoustus TaxID=1810923 RepID=A0ABR4JAC2_9EURO
MARGHRKRGSNPGRPRDQHDVTTLPAGYFIELPFEIVDHIASYMDRETIIAFRYSNKFAAQYSDYPFKRNYCHTLCTDFSRKDFEMFQQRLSNRTSVFAIDTLSISAKIPMGTPEQSTVVSAAAERDKVVGPPSACG